MSFHFPRSGINSLRAAPALNNPPTTARALQCGCTLGTREEESCRGRAPDQRCSHMEEQRRRQNTSAWRQWVAEKLFNAAGAPTQRLCRELWDARLRSESSGQQRPSASAKRVPAGQGWGREGGNSPHPGQHRSQPAASTQSDLFPLPSLAPSLANAVCVAHCIARAQKMTGAKKDGDVCIPHSPSRSWGRRQVLWAAPGLEPPWLLPSSGQVS